MKTNIFKYIFFIILIALICVAIYVLYKDAKKNTISSQVTKIELNISHEMNIGIANYDNINPILSNNRDVQYIDKLIFQSILDITYDFKIENLLAKEFSKINSTTYIIKLREDVFWHDGTKFTAEDVVFTIRNLMGEKINSIYNENVKNIDNVEKIDECTVKIILKEEDPFFEYKMIFPILSSHGYEEGTLNCKTKIPIGTGVYKIDSIEQDKIIILNNENDFKIKKINVILKDSIKDLYNAFSKNEIDYMITDNISYEEYIGTMGYNVNQVASREYEFLVLNNENYILKDKEIRKAIKYSIDRNYINYSIYNNKYIISDFPLNYGSYLYNENKVDEYDVNKAKDILRNNGWEYRKNYWVKNNKILQFNLIVNKDNSKKVLLAQKIKEQLEETGIIINIVQINNSRYNNYVQNKKYDIMLTGTVVSNSPNIETYLGENNLSRFNNEEINQILKDIKNTENEELLKDKYSKIIEIYKEEVPFVSLYSNTLFVLSGTDLKGDLSFNWYNLFYNIKDWYKID